MRRRRFFRWGLEFLLATAFVYGGGPENVLVVVNQASADSIAIANQFIQKRKIPQRNVCHLRTAVEERFSRDHFKNEVREPIATYLRSNRLQDQILYIVTTRGLPLAIEGDEGPMGDFASLDSELTLLYPYLITGDQAVFGKIENPYFTVRLRRGEVHPFRREEQTIYLVTRLTGDSVADATGLAGQAVSGSEGVSFAFEIPSERRSLAADWLLEASDQLKSWGYNVTLENTGAALASLPAVFGYAVLRDELSAGEFLVPKVTWSPGAVALILGPGTTQDQTLTDQLLNQGVTGWASCLDDPGSDGSIRPQIFFSAYLSGHNLAESFYLATRYLSWRQILAGDPLASPFGPPGPQETVTNGEPAIDPEVGLPPYFAERRKSFLRGKYSASEEAVHLLLQAEALADSGRAAASLEKVNASLGLESLILDSHRLKLRLLEDLGTPEQIFHECEKILGLGEDGPELRLRLARLSLDELGDARRAEPHAYWLWVRRGLEDEDTARLWAEVKWRLGDLDEAEAVYHRLLRNTGSSTAQSLYALGKINWEKGNLDLAEPFLERALASDLGSNREQIETDLKEIRRLTGGNEGGQAPPVREEKERLTTEDLETRPARIVRRKPPVYPKGALKKGLQSQVVLDLLIDEMGQLLKIRPVSGDKALIKAAMEAVERWRFEPKLIRGRPEYDNLTVSIEFRLETSEEK